jgi:hypothetical protein
LIFGAILVPAAAAVITVLRVGVGEWTIPMPAAHAPMTTIPAPTLFSALAPDMALLAGEGTTTVVMAEQTPAVGEWTGSHRIVVLRRHARRR